MRILVHGGSLAGGQARMRMSAAALAMRGQEVHWLGGNLPPWDSAPPSFHALPPGRQAAQVQAEVVLGGSTAPLRIALAGRHARAHCMVLGVEGARLATWGVLDRLAWTSLHSWGLAEEAEAVELRRGLRGLDLERVALWSATTSAAAPDPGHPDTEILERACERALARHRGRGVRPAVFLDRDGTLVREVGYLADAAALELLPGVPGALQNLQAAGYALVVVSNQSGVGRGLFPLSRAWEAMARLRRELRAHGVELDAVYFCPHHPDAGCACRKPGIALLERAAEDLQLSLHGSVVVGDKLLDVATARNAGSLGVLVRTGYGGEEEQRIGASGATLVPDHVCDDLPAAARWIAARGDPGSLG